MVRSPDAGDERFESSIASNKPDFYLVDYEIFLDPKNDYLAKIDKNKIDRVIEENNVKVFILTEEKINAEFIKSLCS